MEHPPSLSSTPQLVKQFILSRSTDLIPDDWSSRSHLGWYIATHPSDGLPIIDVVAACGSRVGWLIGFGVDLDAGLLTDQLSVPAEAEDAGLPSAFERSVYALGGRYLAVLLSDDMARVYLDPCGSLAAVFADELRTVCSTTTLLPGGEESENTDLVAVLDIPNRDNWYPFGLTPRRDARRLEPNHYLDLESWETVRHWPVSPLVPDTSRVAAEILVDEIAETAGTLARHLSDAAPLAASLTAGHDSRMLLASTRPIRDRIDFFTERYRDRTARIDCQIAARIAARHGLSYRIVKWDAPSEVELEAWQYRTGRCVAGRTWMASRTARMSSNSGFKLLGLASEVGRSHYWGASEVSREDPTAEDIVTRLKLPPHPQILEGARLWLDGVPCRDFPTVLDLLYLEQRVGCWAGPQFYGHVASKSDIIGWNHRRVIERCLLLPLEIRAGNEMSGVLIGKRWPDLLGWPFNEFVGLSAFADHIIVRVRTFFQQHPSLRRIMRLNR